MRNPTDIKLCISHRHCLFDEVPFSVDMIHFCRHDTVLTVCGQLQRLLCVSVKDTQRKLYDDIGQRLNDTDASNSTNIKNDINNEMRPLTFLFFFFF